MRLKGEILVSPSGFGVVVLRALGQGVTEVLVLQDPAGETAIGATLRWTDDLLERFSTAVLIEHGLAVARGIL